MRKNDRHDPQRRPLPLFGNQKKRLLTGSSREKTMSTSQYLHENPIDAEPLLGNNKVMLYYDIAFGVISYRKGNNLICTLHDEMIPKGVECARCWISRYLRACSRGDVSRGGDACESVYAIFVWNCLDA